jgi:hypothetical protein
MRRNKISIVMLKLPEIKNKQMYSTVKEKNGFIVDQTTKEDVMRSTADNRNVYDESVEEQSNTDRPLAVVPTYKKTSTDAHKNIMNDCCDSYNPSSFKG